MEGKKFAAKLCAAALFLTTVISGPAFAATQTQYSEFGVNWQRVVTPSAKSIATSDNGQIVYMVDSNYVQFSSDYGKTWIYRNDGYVNAGTTAAISVSSDGRVAAIVQKEGHIYITSDFGVNWVQRNNVTSSTDYYDPFNFPDLGMGQWECVSVSESGQRIIVTEGPYTYISNDYGSTFSVSQVSAISIKSMGMSGDGRIVLLASNTSSKVFISNDYGSSFSRVNSLGLLDWTTVAVSGDGRYLLAGAWDAGIWISTNTGTSWTQKSIAVTDKNWFKATISSYGERIVILRENLPPITSGDFGGTFSVRDSFIGSSSNWTGLASNSDASRIYLSGNTGVYTSVVTSYSALVESNSGTVTFKNSCTSDTSTVTSVQAQSVLLVIDTATVATDTNDYHYYTETNTALWGASYNYGSTQSKIDCSYRDMAGSMTLARGPFIASSGSGYSETSTVGQNADFVQYIGNTNPFGAGYFHDNNCGNTTVANINVANACDFTNSDKQKNWPRLDTGVSQVVRSSLIRSGVSLPKTGVQTTRLQAATIFVIVKAKKSVIAAAPNNTSWVATETFTVTSA